MKRHGWVFVFGGLSLAGLACGHQNLPPKNQPSAVIAQAPSAPPSRGSTDQALNLSSEIRQACKIDDTDRSPKFDFDSSQLSGNDRDVLQKVADCLTTGPLKGRSVNLTGRADPRGEAEYNMNLGESRASSVRSYLRALGIAEARMSETSRGSVDANGHDEETWRRDRRVDIALK